MQRLPLLRSRRVVILVLAVAMAAATLFLAAPRQAAAIVCPMGDYPSRNTIYFNDAKHSKEVGECFGCDGTCTGEQTSYYISLPTCCPGD